MRKALLLLGILIASLVASIALSGCGEKAGGATSPLCDSLWSKYEYNCKTDRCARPSLDEKCYDTYRKIALDCPTDCKEDLISRVSLTKENAEVVTIQPDLIDPKEENTKAIIDDSTVIVESADKEEAVHINTDADALKGQDTIATVDTIEQNTDMLSTCNCIISSRLVCYDGHQWNETMQMTNEDPCTCEYVQSSPLVACNLIYPQSSGYCLPDASGCNPNK